jgi:succinylarginine dihydrolase
MKKSVEANFDGLVGPTHNYAGLSKGNVASQKYARKAANPKKAALEGLKKMKLLMDLGLSQGIIPPQERPHIEFLRRLGIKGSDSDIIHAVAKIHPLLLAIASSASSMWTANAATVTPSIDTADLKVHFTPANLISNAHRALESQATSEIFNKIFASSQFFVHHAPLPVALQWSDEGAANHTRLSQSHSHSGIHIFVYGKPGAISQKSQPLKFPARQTLEASKAIARKHGLSFKKSHFIQQNPRAIDQGAFHNDVISVGNENVFLYHQNAFLNSRAFIQGLKKQMKGEFFPIEVKSRDFSIPRAVSSYFFNSQLVTLPDKSMALIAPLECKKNKRVKDFMDRLLAKENPIKTVHYLNLRQSMQNGGGPACLRLRVVLTPEELAATHQGCLLTDDLYCQLVSLVEKHYRDRLTPKDLGDPELLHESRTALDELSQLLHLGSIYSFQK